MKYHQKKERQGNSLTCCFDIVTPYITRTPKRLTKGSILPFSQKVNLGIVKNYRGITLTSIVAKIYNALLPNRIEPEIEKILSKNENGFRRNRSTTSLILIIRWILKVRALKKNKKKNVKAILLFVDFSDAFDFIHRGKTEQILVAYGLLLPRKTVTATMMLYKNTKLEVRSRDGDTYWFIICLDYVLGMVWWKQIALH